jgi:hypothetical protein
MKRRVQQLATVVWPAFLLAAVLEVAVFAFVDPLSLHSVTGAALQLSATAVYSLAFLVFWICTSAACALTLLLASSAEEINGWR